MLISEIARKTGLSPATIRYYERLGLLDSGPRLDNNYRRYNEEAVRQLHFVRNARQMGFRLSEIYSFLKLLENAETVQDVVTGLSDKLCELDQKLAALQRVRNALATALVGFRQGPGSDWRQRLLADFFVIPD
ncbi:MAG: MerR family transcriptional regulator [Leptospirales bacterium]|nr:MerR family transcriptional regulator [Leptospirales bacterium]